MRILILDAQANALDWALRCIEAGHQVKWYVPDRPRTDAVGKGLVPKVPEWQPWVLWADMVFVSDNTRYLRELEVIRRQPGHPAIIAATEETADWELNRDRGMALFRSHGIDVAPSKNFTDYDQAIAYVKKQDRAFVSKPSGDADKALSYVGKTPEDLIYMLQRWKKLGKLKAPFILQVQETLRRRPRP
jgi:phosphoribosylamine--glycine ligase